MEKYENLEYVIPYIVVLLLFVVVLLVVFTRIHLKAQKKIYEAQIAQGKLEIQHQKEVLNKVIQVQEEERKRIGRIIHDDIGNRINILSMCAQNIEMKEGRSKEILLNQLPLLSEAARNISHEMYPVEIEYLGLLGKLEEIQLYLFEKINFQIYTPEELNLGDLQIEIQIYRIVQEFINNVIKYAAATQLRLYIRQTDRYLAIVLQDNGNGFNLAEVEKGMGMKNIEYRVHSLSGIYKWKSTLGKGTSLLIKIQNKYEK
ncbi:histidine kinase [Myroides sp. 1354]|uniref:sensor histidine kinase n=1 Tax=unclassified Myroides TaxID=2642485 RepID=UPI002576C367|nr:MULTISPECIES: ATP-binding protein [unclassified Myroides]MDM1046147.1 histidine kinase [Myroides sp. R163-1]MDM1057137.1 histidine kinase [Myroides sp. 1354]MDM1070278.1 histidine kinase [Myroides sp. 1372]